MLDHVSLRVSNYEKSKVFFLEVLRPLGYKLIMEFPKVCGLGVEGKSDFWVSEGRGACVTHIAFTAENRKRVDAFYQAALAAGGKDNGAPGIRKEYHENYYGAFVLDLDGNNIEAVCHKKV